MRILRNLEAFTLAAAITIALPATVPAQAGPGRSAGGPRYDIRTEITISGAVEEVKEVEGPGRSTGLHLLVKTNNAVTEVSVGPTWYLTQQKCVFAKGDQVEVTGSKAKVGDKDVILSREIKKGDSVWSLRDAQGIPRWSRGKLNQ